MRSRAPRTSPRCRRVAPCSCRSRWTTGPPRWTSRRRSTNSAGSSVFPYYPNIPGPLLPEGARLVVITSDPDEAARAPMGDALVADVRLTLEALIEALPSSNGRTPPQPLDPPFEVELTDPMNASTAMRALGEVFPENGIVVLEAPSATLALRNQLRLSKPGSYYFGAGGGLGVRLRGAWRIATS